MRRKGTAGRTGKDFHVKCGIADKKLEDSFVVEDTYCSDSRLNAMEHYREIEESREEQ